MDHSIRHAVILTVFFLIFAALPPGQPAALLAADVQQSPAKPNIVLIFADDLGYGDVGRFKPDAPKAQLYDLQSDPSQTSNVIREHPDVAERLQALLDNCQIQSRTASN